MWTTSPGPYGERSARWRFQQEIDRARRDNGRLVLAFVDVDGLKAVNDQRGHGEGDDLLRAVVSAIRSRMRSYEPIVRYGGDEFVCALGDIDLDGATMRFEEIRGLLQEQGNDHSVTVGLAALRTDDQLEDLIARADQNLVKSRS